MRTPKELGQAISALRHEKGLTQKALAEKIHVTDKAISRWERGLGYPDLQLLERLCEVLETPLESLLRETVEEKRGPGNTVEAAEKTLSANEYYPNLGEDGARLKAIHEAYTKEREAYQARLRKRNHILLITAAVILCGILLFLIPWQKRKDRILYGEYTSKTGDILPVRVTLKGYLQKRLLGKPYYNGDFKISQAENGELLFERRIVGRKTGHALEMPGPLIKLDHIYMLSGLIYLPETNQTGQLSLLLSDGFSRIFIYTNDALPGQVIAASDPDMDLKKVKERFLTIIHISE